MRRFVVIGQKATASPDFSLLDIAGTSGRLDVLLRCIRAALLVSHGLRGDTVLYLVLLGGPRAPRALRIEGSIVRFLRPDERTLGVLLQKALSVPSGEDVAGAGAFVPLRRGISVVDGGLEAVLHDIGPATYYVLEEGAPDVRGARLDVENPVFVLGDHQGFDPPTRARLAEIQAAALGLGPVSIHTDDAITVVSNELDRRLADRGANPAPAPRS
ncbi:hypothetical protein [Pendulispora albinea]|uniref:tRNA (pseudouridine(54)-N(1))-methyltransferase n=1 Tax=Pendulispora albinea TaxID=2741071 RepID=A0ABZ2M7S4_9BACT